ncbi:Dyp-type peroxidase [Microbacterium sp. EST19A]|uniref:Dyp-type peroxidase n=1 Tax=Microbacterium sp. EST19A TaxID=2862681 RepID=UPI001CBD66C2|nr:Dyp-type peroxidase [Microbacterium sp. EST19A]
MANETGGISRRSLLTSGGIAALGTALAGCAPGEQVGPDRVADAVRPVAPMGEHQAGISRPAAVQPHLILGVHDVDGDPASVLARIGESIVRLTSGEHPALAGIAPGDLSMTVGVGPRLMRQVDADGPGTEPLPAFPREDVDERHRGGDLVIQVCASDPLVPALALAGVIDDVPELVERWRQCGTRGPSVEVHGTHSAPRNVLGFVDGIAAPLTDDELAESVWIRHRATAGASILVVRRMEIDLAAFRRLPVAGQEGVIGRERASSAPLSGGEIGDDVDLQAKSPDGSYMIPVDAHVRRAHPRPAGVPLMLRRSYSMDDPLGLLFVSYQAELRTFTQTMERMSESDALLDFTRTTATGTFLALPGFDAQHPLGSTIFGAS